MNYMLLIYEDPAAYANASEAEMSAMMGEYYAFTQAIVASGELVAGDPLQGVDTATTVTVRGGSTIVTDGPFAETKEVLGGYYIVNTDTLEGAQHLASQIPGAKHGKIEVRAIMDLSGTDMGGGA
jgi:hypothetical protein